MSDYHYPKKSLFSGTNQVSFHFTLVIVLLALFTQVQAQLLIPGATKTAETLAKDIQTRLKESGMVLDKTDILKAKKIAEHRINLMKSYRAVVKMQRAFKKKGDQTKVAELKKYQQHLKNFQKRLPTYQGGLVATTMEANRFRNFEMKQQVPKLREIADYIEKNSKDLDLSDLVDAADMKAPPSKGAPPAKGYEGYIIKKSGDFDFYVNGNLVKRDGQTFKVTEKDFFTMEVRGIGDKRKQIRKFNYGENTSLIEQNDFELSYKVDNGKFVAETQWALEKETYRWNVLEKPNNQALDHYGTSEDNKLGVKNAVMFKFSGVFSYKAEISGEMDWTGSSIINGKKRNRKFKGKAKGSIHIALTPKN